MSKVHARAVIVENTCTMAKIKDCNLVMIHACTDVIACADTHTHTIVSIHARTYSLAHGAILPALGIVRKRTRMYNGHNTCVCYGHAKRLHNGRTTSMIYVHCTSRHHGHKPRIVPEAAHVPSPMRKVERR